MPLHDPDSDSPDGRATRKLGRNDKLLHVAFVSSTTYVALKLIVIPGLSALVRLFRRGNGPPPGRSTSSPLSAPQSAELASTAAVPRPQGEDKWRELELQAPPCPADFKPVATGSLPCSVQDFYTMVLSGQSPVFPDVHARVGKQWDVTLRRYRAVTADCPAPEADDQNLLGPDQSVFDFVTGAAVAPAGYTRTLTFVNPKKPPSSVDAQCVQRQQVAVYEGGNVVFATAMSMLNIPYKDAFMVCTFWQVQPGAEPGTCSVTISLKIKFLRRVLVGGIINATSFRDTAPFYRGFLEAARAYIEAQPPNRRGPGGMSRQRSMAPSLARSPSAVLQRASPEASGASPALSERLPLSQKQTKSVVAFLLLTLILLYQVYLHRTLQQHIASHHLEP